MLFHEYEHNGNDASRRRTDLTWLLAQAVLLAGTALGLFALREQIGAVPLYVFLGTLQVLQTLGASIFVSTPIGLTMSPGSSLMFVIVLVAVLLVYIREDALEARRLIYALVIGNVLTGVLLLSFAGQLQSDQVINASALLPGRLFSSAGLLILGTCLLILDALGVAMVYEYLTRRLPAFLAMQFTLWLVLTLDSLAFFTIAFWQQPDLLNLVINGTLAKCLASSFYVVAAWWYLLRFEAELTSVSPGSETRGVFAILTYRQRYEQARMQSLRDGLTGAFNRRYFEFKASQDLAIARQKQRPFTLMLLDLDHFKQINDRHGHLQGDKVLIAVAEFLTNELRDTDYSCRFGGEEFVVVLPNTDLEQAAHVAKKLCSAMRHMHKQGTSPVAVTCSIGVATFPEDGDHIEALVHRADQRLYLAKTNGRDRVIASNDPDSRAATN